MTILTAFLVNFISITAGTFLGNLGLLWLIGRRAEAIEKQNLKKLQEIREAVHKQIQEEVKKKQEYIKMES